MSDYLGPGSYRPIVAAASVHRPVSRWYPYPGVPTPRLLTYNIRSYSSVPTSASARLRGKKLLTNLTTAMAHSDIVLIQETKIQNDAYYWQFRRDWYVFHNPYPAGLVSDSDMDSDSDSDSDDDDGYWPQEKVTGVRAKAGTDIFVRKSFAHNFNITHVIDRAGYIHHLIFEPCTTINPEKPYFSKAFTVFNVYVPTDGAKSKIGAFQDMADAKVSTDFVFAGGDWNTIPGPAYTAGGKLTSANILIALDKALDKHGLAEVEHPVMTRISGHSPPKVSRLDRWYVSHTGHDLDLAAPVVWLPPHRHEPGGGKPPSDHFPVHLSFESHSPPKGRRRIPRWLAGKPEFAASVAEQ